jgi:hypothetical protein
MRTGKNILPAAYFTSNTALNSRCLPDAHLTVGIRLFGARFPFEAHQIVLIRGKRAEISHRADFWDL